MSLLIVRPKGDGYQWYRSDSNQGQSVNEGSITELSEQLNDNDDELWLALAGEHFFLKSVAYSDKEKRHLRQTIPYQLEESLIDDIEEFHIALGVAAAGKVAVAACNRDWLEQQLTPFIEADIDVKRVVPETLLLQREEGWALNISGEQVYAHLENGEGFVLEPALALESLNVLRANHEQETLAVTLTADDQQQLDNFAEQLEGIAGLAVEKSEQSWWQALQSDTTPEIDLRQGEFGRQLPVMRWWQQWQKPAIYTGVTLLVYLGISLLQYSILQDRNLQLRQQIEKEFRSVVPRGAVVDPERQLRSKVKSLSGSSGSSAAIPTLAKVAPVLAANQDLVVRALNYSSDTQEMRLSFWARSFNDIEQVRAKIAELGMNVELVQSSADGDGHQARLRIRQEAST